MPSPSQEDRAADAKAREAEIDGENGILKGSGSDYNGDKYPSGEFQFREYGVWKSFVVKCRMLFAFPWERVRKGSVLTMKLRGQDFRCLRYARTL